MATYSHSRISTFEQCSLKFKYAYIDKVKTEILRTIETFMGDLVHQTLEKLYKDLKFQKLNELDELLKFYNDLWEKLWDDRILIVKDQYDSDNYKKMGEKMISDYYKRYHPFNQTKTIGLETQDFYDLDETHKIHVRIDRLACPEDGVYEIHDYKTNSHMKTQEEADKDRQLAVYALGVKKLYSDAKRVKLIWHMLAFDKEVVSERTDEELEELKKEVLKSIKEIEEATVYAPKKSALCSYCEFQSICPLWKHLFEIEKKTPEEFKSDDGVKLVDKYVLLKKEEKELSERMEFISEQIKKFGEQKRARVIFGSTHAVTVWSKDTVKFPGKKDENRQKFIDALKALNLYDKYLDINNWDFEKDYDSLTQIDKQVLNNFGKQQKIYRLYLRER